MKTKYNILFTVIIIATSFQLAFSQAKNQHTLLQEIGEGSVFKKYYGITKEGSSYSGEANIQCELKFENNIHNKLSAFILNKEGKDEMLINSGFKFLKPNHYTEPSMFYSKTHKLAYIYIDGLLYGLKGVSDPASIQNIVFENIYVLVKPSKGEHTSGKAATKEFKSRDHEAVIKQYLSEMKTIQDKATANFSTEILAEIDAIENKNSADKKAIKDANDAYWQSAEGQKKLGEMRKSPVYIYNDTQSDFLMTHGSGAWTVLKPGEKKEFTCVGGGKVYKGKKRQNSSQLDSTDQLLIDLNGSNCGVTYNASQFK